MKKIIITISLLIIIAIGFLLYKNYKDNVYGVDNTNETNTAVIVRGFLDNMIAHHEEAVNISKVVMNDLEISDPKVRILAANVVDQQTSQIDMMKNIYRIYLYQEYDRANVNYHNMMSADISTLKGDELAKVYKKDMIKHHKDAIDIAEDYIKLVDKIKQSTEVKQDGLVITSSHPAIDESYMIAKDIIEKQEKEIDEMKGW